MQGLTDMYKRLVRLIQRDRSWLIEYLFIISFIIVSVFYYKDVKRLIFKYSNPDELILYDTRFAEIKRMLPSWGIIGYASDSTPHLAAMKFYYTQYALAPLVLVRDTTYDFIVCYFFYGKNFSEFVKKGKFKILRNFEHNVALLRKEQ